MDHFASNYGAWTWGVMWTPASMCDHFDSGLWVLAESCACMRPNKVLLLVCQGREPLFAQRKTTALTPAGGAGMGVFCGVSRPCQDGIVVKDRSPARRVGLTEVLEICTSF